MIEGYSPLVQALLATLLTWGLTALGSAMVFFFTSFNRKFLDGSLGFASGVMTAASFWSLLLPALEIGEQMHSENKIYTLFPVVFGFLLGASFVYVTDILIPDNFLDQQINAQKEPVSEVYQAENSIKIDLNTVRQRQSNKTEFKKIETAHENYKLHSKPSVETNFRRIFLLVIAVTVHNIPEGLAVGVGFGAIGKSKTATLQNARNLAIGIGIQNFPEGLAVSLPLYASGVPCLKSFWYGQLSGMVEPIAGVLGVLAVNFAQACLPYALSFAAGAMLFVVFDNLMPEAISHGNSKLSTWCCMLGFCLMMSLDVGLS